MHAPTTPRKVAVVLGPDTWGDRFVTEDDQRLPVNRREAQAARDERRARADAEARGLAAALDGLSDDVVLLVPTSGRGAARQAVMWAGRERRQTIAVPVVLEHPATAEAVVLDVAAALASAGHRVRVFVCTLDGDDPAVGELAAGGLDARAVLPAPDPDDATPDTPAPAV